MSAVRPFVAIYADESCLGNGKEGENPGGAGVLVEYLHKGELVRRALWVAEPSTTNNRMALRSVIEAMNALSGKGHRFRVLFTTDSRYIVDGMSTWVHDWARRGWKRKSGAIENLDLWQEAVRVASKHDVSWRWVRGHNGHAQNEFANDIAVRAAETQESSAGLVDAGFDTWLAAKSAKAPPRLDPFPDPDTLPRATSLP